MTVYRISRQHGAITTQLLVIVGLLVLVVGLSGLSAWLYMQYDEQKSNVDGIVAVAEAAARKKQAEEDDVKIKAVEEEPNREFAGPEDYGRLSFQYPKNWSVYIADDASGGTGSFNAFLHPVTVPSLNSRIARFALRVNIETVPYDRILDRYKTSIQRGDLVSSPITVNGHEGTRLDGSLGRDVRGSTVLFRVRDKTITITSEAETFKDYFDAIVKTINFND